MANDKKPLNRCDYLLCPRVSALEISGAGKKKYACRVHFVAVLHRFHKANKTTNRTVTVTVLDGKKQAIRPATRVKRRPRRRIGTARRQKRAKLKWQLTPEERRQNESKCKTGQCRTRA